MSVLEDFFDSGTLRFGQLDAEKLCICRRFIDRMTHIKRHAVADVRSLGTEDGLRSLFGQVAVRGMTETEVGHIERSQQRLATTVGI